MARRMTTLYRMMLKIRDAFERENDLEEFLLVFLEELPDKLKMMMREGNFWGAIRLYNEIEESVFRIPDHYWGPLYREKIVEIRKWVKKEVVNKRRQLRKEEMNASSSS